MVMQVINLKIGSSLSKFEPTFDIEGLAAGYDKPPLMISGILLKFENTIPETPSDENLIQKETIGVRGGLSIGLKQVSLTVLASYAYVKEYDPPGTYSDSFHSFFLFGYLGAPIGGPPFLYVSGLALGVGFNMGLNLPPPEELTIFPLTAAALKPPGQALTVSDLKEMMLKLDKYMPIKKGNFWFAIGIKFESFKFLSGFIMLTLEFGDELEIGVIGILDAMMPVGAANPVIRISIGFTVRILPERGIVEARGAFLPTTFLFHEDVKLTGGMALLAIMKDQPDGEWEGGQAGDFIFTLGGYGPLYTPKPYYPTVPALKLEWKLSENLFITASAYFALTPEAIMMGGHLHGHFDFKGGPISVEVDFKIGADFILYWQPVKYIGQASAELHIKGGINVDLGLFSIDYSLEMDASAKLKIWGPEFSGEAHVKLHFIVSFSVDVSFGAADKDSDAIDWETFKTSLLPKADGIVSMNIAKGVISESSERVVPTLNPYEASLVIDSQIPIVNSGEDVGIKPMGVKAQAFASPLSYTFYKYDLVKGIEVEIDSPFEPKKVHKNVPAALWMPAKEEGKIPASNGQELIESVVCGYELTALIPVLTDTESVDPSSLDDVIPGPIGQMETSEFYNHTHRASTPEEYKDLIQEFLMADI